MPQRKQLGLGMCLICSLVLANSARSAVSEDLESATQAAKSWIKLIDTEQYEKSWQLAAPIFTGSVSLTEWIKSVQEAREPFGQVDERELSAAEKTRSLPGAPEGSYAVLQFRTSFERDKEALETVTMMYIDKRWNASGYFIKPIRRQ